MIGETSRGPKAPQLLTRGGQTHETAHPKKVAPLSTSRGPTLDAVDRGDLEAAKGGLPRGPPTVWKVLFGLTLLAPLVAYAIHDLPWAHGITGTLVATAALVVVLAIWADFAVWPRSKPGRAALMLAYAFALLLLALFW